MSKTTLRKWLDDAGFDWTTGRIVFHADADGKPCSNAYDKPVTHRFIGPDHPVLDLMFEDGFGSPECPSIIAKDDKAIFFPSQYDGSTTLERVETDLEIYLDPANPTPYPGGS